MKGISLLAALLIAIPAAASAQSTVQAFGGRTSVFPSDELLTALAGLQLELEPIKPGRTEGERITFRIPGGAIDLDTLAGEIFHLGGLRITDGATEVALLDFVIDTIAAPLLTGLVVVDGSSWGVCRSSRSSSPRRPS